MLKVKKQKVSIRPCWVIAIVLAIFLIVALYGLGSISSYEEEPADIILKELAEHSSCHDTLMPYVKSFIENGSSTVNRKLITREDIEFYGYTGGFTALNYIGGCYEHVNNALFYLETFQNDSTVRDRFSEEDYLNFEKQLEIYWDLEFTVVDIMMYYRQQYMQDI